MTVAVLGIEARSNVPEATAELKSLVAVSHQAEAAVQGLKAANTQSAVAIRQVSASAEQEAVALRSAAAAAQLHTMAMQADAAASRAAANNRRLVLFQLNDFFVSLASGMPLHMVAIQQGSQLAQVQGGLAGAFKTTAGIIGQAATRFPLLTAAIAAGSVALVGMQYEINATSDATVTLADVALANLQVIRDGVISAASAFYEHLRPAVDALAPIFASAWDQVISGFKLVNNTLIAGWGTAFDAIKTGVMALPDAFAAAGEAAANAFLQAVNEMVRNTIVSVNDLISRIREATIGTSFEGMGRSLPMLSNRVPLYQVDIGGADALERLNRAWDGFKGRTKERFGTDYLGEYFEAVKRAAEENARLREAATDAGGAMKDAAKGATDAWAGLREVSPGVREEMRELKRQSEETARIWERFGDGATNIFGGLLSGTLDWREALRSAIPLLKDLILNLAQAGTLSGGGSFLSRLIGSFFGGGGFPSAPGIGLYARGGAFDRGNVVPFARGGVVSQPTMFPMAKGAGLMGEAGPEAIMPLRRGSDGKLGVSALAGANQNIAPVFNFAPVVQGSGNKDADAKLLTDMRQMWTKDFTPMVVRSLREIKLRGLT